MRYRTSRKRFDLGRVGRVGQQTVSETPWGGMEIFRGGEDPKRHAIWVFPVVFGVVLLIGAMGGKK